MSGTVRFALNNNVTGAAGDTKTRASFFWIANFLDNHPAYSRVASYYGGGTGWLDSGEKTFGVWRNNSSSYGKWDIFVGWSYNSYPNSSNPFWKISVSNFGVGIGIAAHSTSVAWQGTTNNDGTDTFGNFVSHPWKTGSVIFPATNGKHGTNSIIKNAMLPFRYNAGTGTSRIHAIGDNDNLAFLYSEANDSVFNYAFYFCEYTPVTSSYVFPYMMYLYNTDISTENFIRSSPISEYQGGISFDLSGAFSRGSTELVQFDYNQTATDILMPVNFQTGKIFEYPLQVAAGGAHKSYGGFTNFLRIVSKRLSSRDRLGSATRMVVGNGTGTGVSASVPWDGSTNPGGGTSHSGTNEFVTSSILGLFSSQSLSKILSNITTTVTTTVTVSVSSSTDLWRYFSAGNYLFSTTFPSGQTDIVKVR